MCLSTPVNLLIADDHPLFVEGLSLFIKQFPDFNIVGTATNGCSLLHILRQFPVDIVITDLHMPFKDGVSTCREIRALYPEVKIMVLSFSVRESIREELKYLGVKSILNKDIDPVLLLQELRKLANLECSTAESGKKAVSPDFSKISAREQQIVSLIIEGFTSAEIAKSLFLSVHTVSQHRKNILNKLKLKNVKELVAYGVRNQL